MSEETETMHRNPPMDLTNFEYRLQQLESERLPRRVAEVEFITAQLQGEVTAVKEIARGIGVKLDAGIEKLSTNSSIEIAKLQAEQIKAMSFTKGAVWVLSTVGAMIALGPIIGDIFRKMMGA